MSNDSEKHIKTREINMKEIILKERKSMTGNASSKYLFFSET